MRMIYKPETVPTSPIHDVHSSEVVKQTDSSRNLTLIVTVNWLGGQYNGEFSGCTSPFSDDEPCAPLLEEHIVCGDRV